MNTIVKRNELFHTCTVDNEMAVMDKNNGSYIGLNTTGKAIWDMLRSPLSFDNIVTNLSDLYEKTKEDLTKDTLDFLARLLSMNILLIEGNNQPVKITKN
jgi:hypothetical protein